MDLTESFSNSSLIFPSPVTEIVLAAPATMEKDINVPKRKRGRPRKNDGEGKLIKQYRTPAKRLGNMRGAMRLGEGELTPHIFTISRGEDVIERIMSFTENGSRGIHVLTVNGAVANVKIQLLGLIRNVIMFQDAYEIVSLSSTLVATEEGGVKTGGWTIRIAGGDGCVTGGTLAGRLIAASKVQVVIGTFWPLITNPRRARKVESIKVVPPQTRNDESIKVVPPQTRNDESTKVVPPQTRNDESKVEVVPPKIPNALASSSGGQVQQPTEMDLD